MLIFLPHLIVAVHADRRRYTRGLRQAILDRVGS